MSTTLAVLTIIKALLILVGIGLALWHLYRSAIKKEADGGTKSLKYFFGTALLVITLSVVEYIVVQ